MGIAKASQDWVSLRGQLVWEQHQLSLRGISILTYLAAVAGIALAVWWWALGAALGQLAERAEADLRLASDRLVGELQGYRELAVLLAAHPGLTQLVGSEPRQSTSNPQKMLQSISDMTGAQEILVLNQQGEIVAQSHPFVNDAARNFSQTPFFSRAIRSSLGGGYSVTGSAQRRAFTFAAPIFDGARRPVGALAVSVDLVELEAAWQAVPQILFFSDQSGRIFVSNRSEILALSTEDQEKTVSEYQRASLAGFDLWTRQSGTDAGQRLLHLQQALPFMNMTGDILIASSQAERLAILQALVVAGLWMVLGAIGLILIDRRRNFVRQLEMETRANAKLEARVVERTAALEQVQQELVQAGKLSALGKMSAGISHELNQPLMAIGSYAENAEEFLRRDQPDVAAENLNKISDLARRMGRIIKNLRAFARQEVEPLHRVDLGRVIDAVLDLSAQRLRQENVELIRPTMAAPVYVQGGDVRLQQVLMNLINNALDAMAGQAVKRLELSVIVADTVIVKLRDNGPGLSDPEKIFEPFYTTKAVGGADGMGLGLSISYGIVQSFGGDIQGRNHKEGGAEMTIRLTPAPQVEVAA